MARYDARGGLGERAQALERPQVGRHVSVLQGRDLDGREVVAGDQHPRPGDPDGHAVARVTLGGVQLKLGLADPAAARHGQGLHRPERQRTRALEVELLIEAAQLALGGAGLGREPRGGALGAAERQLGERDAPQQVVPIAVGRQQAAGRGKARLRYQRGQQLELLGEHW